MDHKGVKCKKWRLTRIQPKKADEGLVDLDAPLTTSERHLIGNKKAKAAAVEAASSERVQASIDKWMASLIKFGHSS
jgi:hypothetical protein